MVGWHHQLYGHGFGWNPGVGDGPGGLACCSSWGHRESDTTEQLNWIPLTCSLTVVLTCLLNPQPFRQQEQVSWKTIFSWMGAEGGDWFRDDSRTLRVLCTFISIVITSAPHQLHQLFASPGIRSWRLGTCIKAPHVLPCNHHCYFS